MKIREAGVDDASTIALLGASIQHSHHLSRPDWFKPADATATVDMYREMLENPAVTVYVAEEGDDAIGFIVAIVHQRLETPLGWARTVLEVEQVGVAPSARRRGVGRALVGAVRQLADRVSANRILLTTWTFNHEAHGFFDAEGFTTELHRMTMPWPPE